MDIRARAAFSVIQAVILGFLFWFLETSISVHHPWEHCVIRDLGEPFQHPLVRSGGAPRSQICPFGKWAIAVPVALLLLRALCWRARGTAGLLDRPALWMTVFGVALLLGLVLNMNAFLYLLPVVCLEWVLAPK